MRAAQFQRAPQQASDEAQRSDTSRRDREQIALRLASPKRANAGAYIASQADAGGLPLFIAADEPQLF